MGLQDISAEAIGCTLMSLIMFNYLDKCAYDISKDKFSFSKDRFEDAQFYSKNMDKFLFEDNLNEGELKILNLEKKHAIGRYQSLLEENISKYFMFTRPLFYFKTKKELAFMKEESRKRLEELKVSA